MSSITNSGIKTTVDGTSYIPSSRRADGSTRKEIRVRPGWTPQEDVKTYKSRNAEAWRTRGSGGVPGVESAESQADSADVKSKNAKRREAAKKKQAMEESQDTISEVQADIELADTMESVRISQKPAPLLSNPDVEQEAGIEQQKKIRNQLKKLKAIQELKTKKIQGEKLSPDQLMKLSKEDELFRDLKKLGYEGPELVANDEASTTMKTTTGD
jgi:partner of Y14 and mago protein